MEIRFCDRCAESIPEADFDAGKAVTVGGRHYHASCALAKSLAIAGPRSWLTFLLALAGAAAAVTLVVAGLGREEPPAVTVPVRAAIDEAVEGTETRLVARMDAGLGNAHEALDTVARKTADAVRGELRPQLEQVAGRLQEAESTLADRLEASRGRMDRIEKEMAALSALLHDVREQADRIEAQRVAAAPPPAPAPEPAPPAPEPATPPGQEPMPADPPPSDPAQEEEVERWIRRLKDPNENIRFTATLQLGLLKSLEATQPLIEALEKDKDYYVRLGAATALGDIRAVDAVPALIEALEDDDALVRTAANDALKVITDHPLEFVPGMSRSERRKLQRQWRDWYETNEAALRERLGQPKTS